MRKKRIAMLFSVAILLMCTYFLTACDFGSLFQRTLIAPTININNEEKTLLWQEVANVETYDIYLNDGIIANVENVAQNVYNFSQNITENMELGVFYVIAKAKGYNESVKSNTATYVNIESNTNQVTGINANNSEILSINITLSGKILFWDKVDNVSEYYVSIFDNINGSKVVSTDIRILDFSSYVIAGQILGFRVGIKNANEEIVFTNTVYYNDALHVSEYNNDTNIFKTEMNNVFIFKGKLYDHYITNQDEMNVGVYYAFVNKRTSSQFAISSTYYNRLCNMYSDEYYLVGNNSGTIPGALGVAASSYTESCHYELGINYVKNSAALKRNFVVLFTFFGKNTEPTLTMDKTLTQNVLDKGYYQKVNYTKRDVNYNNFSSDKNLLIDYVATSEQLYFAVENGVTPLFKSVNSSAYKIYNKSKNILREIISDEMSNYEKALSIFDWICLNSVYDFKILDYVGGGNKPSFTDYTSFSLEGVINDGLAVCDGFSKTFSLLCNMEGIKSVRFSGGVDQNNNGVIDSQDGLHAWNKVLIDGSWYVVDITWSVFDTETNSFSQEGSTSFNSNEFLNHTYFLVSDADIPTHIAADTAQNQKYAAPNRYYYYYNQTYNKVNNLVINKNSDLNNIVAFMLENKIYSLDIVFDYATYGNYTIFQTYPAIDAAIKEAKNVNGITEANILQIGTDVVYVNGASRGLVYSISLINLNKVPTLKNAA